jgi:hypothetical protein
MIMKKIILITAILITANLLFAQIINIPADYPTIEEGIDAATEGDTVLVQPGTYYEDIGIVKNITLASLYLFSGDTAHISQTIIDGNQQGSVIDILSLLPVNFEPTICGFTITNGLGSTPVTIGYGNYGGGILCYSWYENIHDQVKPVLRDLVITNNSAGQGGGIACLNASPLISNVTISNNIATDEIDNPNDGLGGGIYCFDNSSPVLQNVLIDGNIATTGNYASWDGHGGGIYCFDSCHIAMENVKIINNQANGAGGVTAHGAGGGIFVQDSDLEMKNTEISSNTAILGDGNAICFYHANSILTNVTIVDNHINYYSSSGILFRGIENTISITNSILVGNGIEITWLASSDSLEVLNSNIEGGQSGIGGDGTVFWLEGNINEDPMFVMSGDHPYQINDYSPCIDAGTPDTTGLNLPEFDLAGNPRLVNNRIDMGAYEWNMFVGVEEPVINEKARVSIYPNPVNDHLYIDFELESESSITLDICNVSGKRMKAISGQSVAAGAQHFELKMQDLPTGIYFLRLQAGNEVVTKKVVKL